MKAKEKAEKLFYDYLTYFPEFRNDLEYDYNTESAKQCALIAIEFAREFITGDLSESFDKTMYLFEVKQEIEKL